MIVPLHLHTFWIAMVYLYLLIACVIVTLLIGYEWIRWNRDALNGRSRLDLVMVSGLGIVLSGLFWASVLLSPLLGPGDILLEYPEMLFVSSFGCSSSGVSGGYVLWKLRRHRIREQARDTLTE